ncbi:uncharacterized protein K02A2.6-like [Patiria miniata]|uniref:Endonuclease n=1 Tax=Patiria miniata TaxID=46514 RepID=A0A914AJW3_PATMI|nr:uncharacterized protein K02A2.6-like [Patiria miniata]
MASGLIGRIDPYNSDEEDWPTYVERLEQYFEANNIANERKVSALISLIGSKTYTLLKNLTAPEKPSSKPYAELIKILTAHLAPRPLVIAERFRFHKRDQKEGERVSTYLAGLRKLAEHCQFGDYLNEALRDRFVCGLRAGSIQKRLLAEDKLTLKRATEIATAMETAARDAIELHQQTTSSSAVHTVARRKQSSCYRCGRSGHSADSCRFKDATCHSCGKQGHIAPACRSKPRPQGRPNRPQKKPYKPQPNQKGKVKTMEEIPDTDNEDDNILIARMNIHNVGHNRCDMSTAIWVTLHINDRPVKMEVDTGSAITLLSMADYQKFFPGEQLQPTKIKLQTYTGEQISPAGLLNAKVRYNNQEHNGKMYIIKGNSAPLLGRDWLAHIKLDWPKLFAMTTAQPPKIGNTEEKLDAMLSEYPELFQEEIGELKGITGKLNVRNNAQPVFVKTRQVPYALRPKVEAELTKLERQGIISSVESSDWATPIVPVPKPNGGVRICGDFKVTVNPNLNMERYPLPRVEDVFANLSGGQRYSKLDLRQAYLHMVIDAESRKLLTINTHKGLFVYNRLPFGIASAPAMWQRSMEQVLQGIPGVQCILDDMIITGRNDEEHLSNLRRVLDVLKARGLRLNKAKCEFFKRKVVFCGHEITHEGLNKTQDKVHAVKNAPRPTNVSQLRSFLGLVNYYHRFLPNLSTELHPLNELLQKNHKWVWTPTCEKAFEKAKSLITADEVLTHYDPDLPVKLACDASPYGLGAVMSHVMPDGSERPVAYASRTLTTAERNYSQIDKEALALVWGVKKFNLYLCGRKFTLVTDHQPLTSIFNPSKSTPSTAAARLARYAIFLGSHDYTIEYKNTAKHCNADGLSRLPLGETVSEPADPDDILQVSQLETLPVSSSDVRKETASDITLAKVYDYTMRGWPSDTDPSLAAYHSRRNEITVHDNCLMWGLRVIVPGKLRAQVLAELHEGHLGVVKMKSLSRGFAWWPGIDHDIEQLAKECSGCQKTQRNPTLAPLHTWEWPAKPWQRIHVDYAGPFLGQMFLVVVDAHSKWPEVIQTTTATSSQTIDILRGIFAQHGVPEQLVSDNGPQFKSEEFETFLKRNGVKHITSAPYHPATNGLAEPFVQTFKNGLKSMEGEKGHIDQLLDVDTGKPFFFNQQPDPVPPFVPDISDQMTPNRPVPTSPTHTPTDIQPSAEQPSVVPETATEPPRTERRYPQRKRKPPDRLDL